MGVFVASWRWFARETPRKNVGRTLLLLPREWIASSIARPSPWTTSMRFYSNRQKQVPWGKRRYGWIEHFLLLYLGNFPRNLGKKMTRMFFNWFLTQKTAWVYGFFFAVESFGNFIWYACLRCLSILFSKRPLSLDPGMIFQPTWRWKPWNWSKPTV